MEVIYSRYLFLHHINFHATRRKKAVDHHGFLLPNPVAPRHRLRKKIRNDDIRYSLDVNGHRGLEAAYHSKVSMPIKRGHKIHVHTRERQNTVMDMSDSLIKAIRYVLHRNRRSRSTFRQIFGTVVINTVSPSLFAALSQPVYSSTCRSPGSYHNHVHDPSAPHIET